MKLISLINASLENVKKTFRRFYVPLSLAYLAAVSFIVAIEVRGDTADTYVKIAVALILGFVLTFAVDTSKKQKTWGYIISLVLVVAFYKFELNFDSNVMGFRLMFIFGVSYLVAMLAPFFGRKKSENGFWQYNMHMISSILRATAYFGLLYAGIAALLAAFEFLFEIGLHEELFAHVFVLLALVGATTYVVSRVPLKTENLDKVKDYPNELKIITARIFVPVIGVYALLVYAFVLKLLLNGMAPDYEVTFQIMAFSSVGVLAYLFAWPLRSGAGYLKHFHKYFFAYLIPLLVTLFVAIIKASFAGGLTQTRYFVIAFGVIMTFWSFYYLIGKRKDIRLVHIFAGAVSLFALFMPFVGAVPLSLHSHTVLIENGLVEAGIVVDGNYVEFDKEIEVPRNVAESLRYLDRSYSEADVNDILEQFGGDSREEWITRLEAYGYYFDRFDVENNLINHSRFLESFDVEGFSQGYRFDVGRRINDELASIKDGVLRVRGIELNIDEYAADLSESSDLTYIDPAGQFVIYFENIWGEDDQVESASGFVFIK